MTKRPSRWDLFWGVLAVVVLGAYGYFYFSGEWQHSLTNTLLRLVERYPWHFGIPFALFLVWLALHFLVPIVRRWVRGSQSEE